MFKIFTPALIAGLLCVMPVLASGSGSGGSGKTVVAKQLKVEGKISAVTTDSVTITTQNGTKVTITVNAATKIERNGARSTLATFKIGDRGQAVYAAGGLAIKVEATGF